MTDDKAKKTKADVTDFLSLLIAAMTDAALEGENTQLQTTITPDGHTKAYVVRIIVIPEIMPHILGGS